MEREMEVNRYDLFCIMVGSVSMLFFKEALLKIAVSIVAMVISTTIAYFWRRYLHVKMRDRIKAKNKNDETR